MLPGADEVYENITELGEDRVPSPAPSAEFLADMGRHLSVCEHHKPSVFTEVCNDMCRFAYDHAAVVGSASVLQKLFSALNYKPNSDDEDEGVLTVPVAAIKALAVLTSNPIVRGYLNGISEGLVSVIALMQLPYATTEVRNEALTTLTNACCSRPLALVVGRQPMISKIVCSLISPPHTIAVQGRALSLASHLVCNMPSFVLHFARDGAVNALATILAAPSVKANFITQNRAALLLAEMAQYPALQHLITETSKGAPELREAAVRAAANAAAAAKAARQAAEDGEGSDEEDDNDEDESEEGSSEEGEGGSETMYEGDGEEEAT